MNLLLVFFILFDMFTSLCVMHKYNKIKLEKENIENSYALLLKENELIKFDFDRLYDTLEYYLERINK